MDYSDKIARYQEIERRGLLNQLPIEKQEAWAEYKRRQTPELNLTDEQKAKIKAEVDAYNQRQEENRPWLDKNPVGRLITAGMQGIANAGLNPAGHVARAFGMDTKPFESKTKAEKIAELAGEYGYDAAVLRALGGIAEGAGYLGEGTSGVSRVAKAVLAPEGGLKSFVAPAVGSAFVRGYTDPRNPFEGFLADVAGAASVGGLQSALAKDTKQVAGGLKNILKDNKANAAVSKGIKGSEEIAQQVSNDAPKAFNQLNAEMENALEKATGRQLNVGRALENQQERMNAFIGRNADYPVYNSLSPEQQAQQNFKRWFDGSQVVDESGQPLKLYHQTGADFDVFEKGLDSAGKYDYETPSGFFFKSNNADIGLQGKKQIPVYIKGKKGISFKNRDEARKYFRENIDGYDDLLTKYNNVDNEYLAKDAQREAILDKRIDNLEKSPAYMNANEATQMKMREDVINSLDDDAFYNEWRDAGNKYAYQMKNKINDYIKENNIDFMRLENDSGSIGKKATDAYIVFNPNQVKSVNNSGAWSSSPSLSDAGWKPQAGLEQFTQGLDDFQMKALNTALEKGKQMSTYEKGSLGATHRAQEVLNDMINASYDTSVIGRREPTTETRELMKVKERLNQMLESSGIKEFDASLSKAKSLKAFKEMGYKFKPSETKFENLGLKTLRDKKAFLQGYEQQIKDNVLSDGGTNLAAQIKKGENVFEKLLPKKQFDSLMKKAGELDTDFKRLKSLEGQANRELVKDTQQGASINRENWESKGAFLGRLSDIANNMLARRGNVRLARQYLDPNTTQITTMGGLKEALKGIGTASTRQTIFDLLSNGD